MVRVCVAQFLFPLVCLFYISTVVYLSCSFSSCVCVCVCVCVFQLAG